MKLRYIFILFIVFLSKGLFGQKYEFGGLVNSSIYRTTDKINYDNVLYNHSFDFGVAFKYNFIKDTSKVYFSIKPQFLSTSRSFETFTSLNENARVFEKLGEFGVIFSINSKRISNKFSVNCGIGPNFVTVFNQNFYFVSGFVPPNNFKTDYSSGSYYKIGLAGDFTINFQMNKKMSLYVGIYGSKDLDVINSNKNPNFKFNVIGFSGGYYLTF